MHRTLIVARMRPSNADAVARIFTESDRTDLPGIIGVSRRTLFRFHGLYFHLIESAGDIAERLGAARDHPLYRQINSLLGQHIRPYDPNWRQPKDAMAIPFYTWEAGQSGDARDGSPQTAVKVAAGAVASNHRRGGDLRVVLGPKTAGATTGFMGVLTLKPGEFVSEHYHPYSEEFLYVVRGRIVVRLDGHEEIAQDADEGLLIPRNVRHRVSNSGAEDAFVVFQLCPLAPRPELGHVDTEPAPNPAVPELAVGGELLADAQPTTTSRLT